MVFEINELMIKNIFLTSLTSKAFDMMKNI
jgi:hypothetical protein